MVLLEEVQFERVAVLGGIVAILAPELVHVRVALKVTVEHGLVDTAVVALGAFEGFGSDVNSDVIL